MGLERLGKAVAGGEIGAVELVRLALDRIERLDGELNAVVALRAELALEEAAALDRRVAAGEAVGRLAGVPLLVKDIEDVAGMRTTFGSLLFADAPPATRDGLVTERLRAEGAIVVGKTNLPEFAAEGYTANPLFGVTRNPWAPEWSPGGSSGGSGAALAAGMAPLATATDGGGSIRIPAAMCGLAGIKPTGGLIGRRPIPDWIDLSTDGPLATSVADLRLLLDIESGPVAGDPTALPVPWRDASASDRTHRAGTSAYDEKHADGGTNPDPPTGRPAWSSSDPTTGRPGRPAWSSSDPATGRPGLRAWPGRVLAAPRFVDHGPLEPAVADLFEKALLALERDLGLAVEPIEPASIFGTGDLDADWLVIAATEHAHKLGRELIEASAERLHPNARAFLRVGLDTSIESYLAARRRRFEYVRELDELLGPDGVIATPTLASSGWLAEGRMPGTQRLGVPDEVYNCAPANMTGQPSLSLPAGRFDSGVGFGLQLTGPRFSDGLLLDLGEAWERARPWPPVAPGYEPFDLP